MEYPTIMNPILQVSKVWAQLNQKKKSQAQNKQK